METSTIELVNLTLRFSHHVFRRLGEQKIRCIQIPQCVPSITAFGRHYDERES